jgi:hypothetical protein
LEQHTQRQTSTYTHACKRVRARKADSHSTGVSSSAITAGYLYTCAVVTNGGLMCWGGNGYGQLGIGSTVDQCSPAAVMLGSGALAMLSYYIISYQCAYHLILYRSCHIIHPSNEPCVYVWGWEEDSRGSLGSGRAGAIPPRSVEALWPQKRALERLRPAGHRGHWKSVQPSGCDAGVRCTGDAFVLYHIISMLILDHVAKHPLESDHALTAEVIVLIST